MPERIQATRETADVKKDEEVRALDEIAETARPVAEKGEELKDSIDDILDGIDEVLETNAEDLVRTFVQKGGQ